jgi:hypothetical protein
MDSPAEFHSHRGLRIPSHQPSQVGVMTSTSGQTGFMDRWPRFSPGHWAHWDPRLRAGGLAEDRSRLRPGSSMSAQHGRVFRGQPVGEGRGHVDGLTPTARTERWWPTLSGLSRPRHCALEELVLNKQLAPYLDARLGEV